jgi:hypothetical protein
LDNHSRVSNWQKALDEIKNQFLVYMENLKSPCNGVHWKGGFDSTTEKNPSSNRGNQVFDTQHHKETDSSSIKNSNGSASRFFSQELNASTKQHVSTLPEGEDDFNVKMVENNAGILNSSSFASLEEIGMNEVAAIKYYILNSGNNFLKYFSLPLMKMMVHLILQLQ